MTRKEQEILAILGLIISLFLVGWTFFNRFTGIEPSQAEIQVPKEETVQQTTQKEKEINAKKEALEYGGIIANALVKEPQYDIVYHEFRETVKEEFNNNYDEFSSKLERMFGRLGKANRIQLTYQEATELKTGEFQVRNSYIIGYPKVGGYESNDTWILEIFVLIDEGEYQLLKIDFQMLSNVGRGD